MSADVPDRCSYHLLTLDVLLIASCLDINRVVRSEPGARDAISSRPLPRGGCYQKEILDMAMRSLLQCCKVISTAYLDTIGGQRCYFTYIMQDTELG